MNKIDTVVIGAGHAGLATSRLLTEAGNEHVVLDRGRLAESWRTKRWDSLRLLTPNWMNRLPGHGYRGNDPEGFLPAAEFAGYLASYAESFNAPVQPWTAVTEVSRVPAGYRVRTTSGEWAASNVVVAAGPRPHVPEQSNRLSSDVRQLHTNNYRNPDQLPAGGVLVVGASASGVQIASELCRAGRKVVLAVGTHSRLPRRYRGMDIMWWLERIGALERTVDSVPDVGSARREPSSQLTGGDRSKSLDLAAIRSAGVTVTGRLESISDGKVHFAGDLGRTTEDAEIRLRRLLTRIDDHIVATGLEREVFADDAIPAAVLAGRPATIDLQAAGVSTVVWATGFRYHYPWLRVPVYDRLGEIQQYQGVTSEPGLYTMGLRFMHRRNSQFIDGARHDARAIVAHLTGSRSLATKG
jgi:putative flavoprotein involved in K+ transport